MPSKKICYPVFKIYVVGVLAVILVVTVVVKTVRKAYGVLLEQIKVNRLVGSRYKIQELIETMNPFRVLGDLSHLASILILIRTVRKTSVIDGISFKTQVLYALVFLTRYLDLFTFHWVSAYNSLMKIVFLASSVYIVVLLQRSKTTNPIAYKEMIMRDSFKIQYILGMSFLLSLFFHHKFTVLETFWSFSVWLESFAILPQLFMLSKSSKAESLTVHYIFALGLYRALYIPNWILRYHKENRIDKIALTAGIVQTLVYSDFFYIYYKKVVKRGGVGLPV